MSFFRMNKPHTVIKSNTQYIIPKKSVHLRRTTFFKSEINLIKRNNAITNEQTIQNEQKMVHNHD